MVANYKEEVHSDGANVTSVHVCIMAADTFWPAFYFVMSITVFFCLPLGVLVILYSVIACHLMSNAGIAASNSHSSALRYRRQVVLMLGTVVFSFFICLLPFRALTLFIILSPQSYMDFIGVEFFNYILYFGRLMIYLNSAINPILYNLMSSKFRDGFRRLLGIGKRDSLGRKGTVTTSTLTTSSSRKSSSDNHLLRRSVVRVISIEESRKLDNGIASIKLLGQNGTAQKDETYV